MKVALDSAADGIEPAISNRKSNALTTMPPSYNGQQQTKHSTGYLSVNIAVMLSQTIWQYIQYMKIYPKHREPQKFAPSRKQLDTQARNTRYAESTQRYENQRFRNSTFRRNAGPNRQKSGEKKIMTMRAKKNSTLISLWVYGNVRNTHSINIWELQWKNIRGILRSDFIHCRQ